jgi:hypothetical protein
MAFNHWMVAAASVGKIYPTFKGVVKKRNFSEIRVKVQHQRFSQPGNVVVIMPYMPAKRVEPLILGAFQQNSLNLFPSSNIRHAGISI